MKRYLVLVVLRDGSSGDRWKGMAWDGEDAIERAQIARGYAARCVIAERIAPPRPRRTN